MSRTNTTLALFCSFAIACGSSTRIDAGSEADAGYLSDGGGLTCVGIEDCEAVCSTASCPQTCVEDGSPEGRHLFEEAQSCLDSACSEVDGGPCASTSSSTCTDCVAAAQTDGGVCAAQVSACEAGVPDAG